MKMDQDMNFDWIGKGKSFSILEGILLIPVGSLPPRSSLKVANSTDGIMRLGPSGGNGYNVVFSTRKSFYELFYGFKDENIFYPGSLAISSDVIIGWYNVGLEELTLENIIRLSNQEDLFFRLSRNRDGRTGYWWYESRHDYFKDTGTFAVYLQEYTERILEVAYKFASYNVKDSDKEWLKSRING